MTGKGITRLLALFICAVGLEILLGHEYAKRTLSPRELGIALLALGTVFVTVMIRIFLRTATELNATLSLTAVPVEREVRRKRRWIHIGEVAIAVLVVLLIQAVVRGGPALPVLVGAAVNVCIIAAIIQVIVRLRRSLRTKS